jgi:phosphoribosylaminoimidazole carboxylase (NCAIR synthetase)
MAAAYQTPGTNVHWYGKDGMKKGRKVGRWFTLLPAAGWGQGRRQANFFLYKGGARVPPSMRQQGL